MEIHSEKKRGGQGKTTGKIRQKKITEIEHIKKG